MNENENETTAEPGFFVRLMKDDGIQRAVAGIVVSVVVATAKDLIFGFKK